MSRSAPESTTRSVPSILHVAPLFPVALGIISGIVADARLTPPVLSYPVILILVTALVAMRRMARLNQFIIFTASLAAGAMLHASFIRITPANAMARFTTDGERLIRVRGVIDDEPELITNDDAEFAAWAFSGDRSAFFLRVESVEAAEQWQPVAGRVQVFVREAVLDLKEGESVELLGRLEPLRPPRNPGAFDWAAYLRRQGVAASITVNHREAIRRSTDQRQPDEQDWLRSFRHRARHMLISDLTPGADQQRSLLEAMVIGHRSRVDRKLNELFITAGCVHFLAVSGVHVLIVMFIARTLCAIVSWIRILLGGAALREATTAWLLLFAVITYMLIAEPRPPILRAGIMAIVYCLARILGRESARLNWIALAVIILETLDPGMVFDIGFQLSTIAVLGVCYLTPALQDGLKLVGRKFLFRRAASIELIHDTSGANFDMTDVQMTRRLDIGWRRLARNAQQAVFVSLAAWIVTLPIVVHHFGRLHPWGPINSLLVLPLVSLVMALGFAKLITAIFSPSAAAYLAQPLESVDSFLIRAVEWLSRLPGANIDAPAQPIFVTLTFYASLIAIVLFLRSRAQRPPTTTERTDSSRVDAGPGVSGWVPLATTALLLLALIIWGIDARRDGVLTLTSLAVGAGSATIIELPEGDTILYDAGSLANPQVGRRVIVPFLRSRGIRRIDQAYISHPNIDHFNGLPGVIEQIKTGPVLINRHFEPLSTPRSPARHLLKLLQRANHDVRIIDDSVTKWHYGGAAFELLWPPDEPPADWKPNDASTVLRITHAGRSILLTGDIEELAQSALISRGDITADVLILPHHGGVETNTQAFIEALDPQVLIRSSHEPLAETTNGLPNIIGLRPLFNTADHGAVTVRIDESGITTSTYLNPNR